MNLCNITKDSERSHRNLGHPPVQQWENLLREAKVCGEATEALNNFSCDACDRLMQPPARRQVALPHAEMFKDFSQ